MSTSYLIIYDISSNKRRNKVGKLINQIGVRIQYSSFYCCVPRTTLLEVFTKLSQLIDKRTDSIVAVHLPDNWEKYVIGTLRSSINSSRTMVL